eukprot:TRINITY_DN27509_c0_g1_i1.p1 TRINITY_DN27509_c0_g1~~TRINITY_DN27509_c0_g1_i1.p1  ORF type:complete len:557 (+),score=63.21 TRINITY_DN27509_c0_g1_i1:181-1851(+)
MRMQQAAEVERVIDFSKATDRVVAMNHDACSSACEPDVPEGRRPDTSPKEEDRPSRVEGATMSCAPKRSGDVYGSCGSVSAAALFIELRRQRQAMRQSLEDAFNTMERNMKRSLQYQRHPAASPQRHGQYAPPFSSGQVACMDLVVEADNCSPRAAEPALPHTPHDLSSARRTACAVTTLPKKKQAACAVTSDSEPSTDAMAPPSFPDCDSHKTTQGAPQCCCNIFVARLRRITDHKCFELSVAALILIHICAMAIEVQYNSLDLCFNLGYPSCERPANEEWPAGEAAVENLNMMFGVLISFEVSLKLLSHHVHFFSSGWNCFDAFISLTSFLEFFTEGVYPHLAKTAHLMKFLRFFRLVKTILMFDVLQLLIRSLRASALLLFWVAVVLAIIMVCAALLASSYMRHHIENDNIDMETRLDAYLVFGSFSRSFLTMYQIAFFLDNAAPGLCFDLNEWLVIPLIVYQGMVSFAIIKVIEAVFLNETLKVAATSDDLKATLQNRLEAMREEKVRAFFSESAGSGDEKWAYRLPGAHEDHHAERTCHDKSRVATELVRS